jgi:DNA-binding transcriptional ArsR family regulator
MIFLSGILIPSDNTNKYISICLNKETIIYSLRYSIKKKNMDNIQSCIRVFANLAQINECKDKLHSNALAFEQLSSLLALAGNEVRLKIMFLLEEENELCPCDLADMLEMSIPAVSQHLRKMKDGNVISARRSGQTIFYSLKKEQLKLLRPFFKYIVINQNSKKEAV